MELDGVYLGQVHRDEWCLFWLLPCDVLYRCMDLMFGCHFSVENKLTREQKKSKTAVLAHITDPTLGTETIPTELLINELLCSLMNAKNNDC